MLEHRLEITCPGTYGFELKDQTPRVFVSGLLTKLKQDHSDISEVGFDPASLDTNTGIIRPPRLYSFGWNPSGLVTPDASPVVLDYRGVLTELCFREESNMRDGSMKYWRVKLEDRGSLRIHNGKLSFTPPYPDRNSILSITLKGNLPEDSFEPDPEIFEPTKVGVNFQKDNPGSLIRSALGYINNLIPQDTPHLNFYQRF